MRVLLILLAIIIPIMIIRPDINLTIGEPSMKIAIRYCSLLGEELEEVRINDRKDEFLCSQNIKNRNLKGVWLNIKEIKLQVEFLESKKNTKHNNDSPTQTATPITH